MVVRMYSNRGTTISIASKVLCTASSILYTTNTLEEKNVIYISRKAYLALTGSLYY